MTNDKNEEKAKAYIVILIDKTYDLLNDFKI